MGAGGEGRGPCCDMPSKRKSKVQKQAADDAPGGPMRSRTACGGFHVSQTGKAPLGSALSSTVTASLVSVASNKSLSLLHN